MNPKGRTSLERSLAFTATGLVLRARSSMSFPGHAKRQGLHRRQPIYSLDIVGDIRAGRDVATRQAMFRDLSLMWTRLTDQPEGRFSSRCGKSKPKMQSKPAGSSPNPVRNNNCSNKRDKADPVGHASALASELRYLWDHARGRFAMRATLRARSWWRSRDGSKSLLRGSRRRATWCPGPREGDD